MGLLDRFWFKAPSPAALPAPTSIENEVDGALANIAFSMGVSGGNPSTQFKVQAPTKLDRSPIDVLMSEWGCRRVFEFLPAEAVRK